MSESRRVRWAEKLARHKKKLIALAAVLLVPTAAHVGIAMGTRIEPPSIGPPGGEPAISQEGHRRLGRAYARRRGKILEGRLAGTPEDIGHAHGRLLYPEMVSNEGTLYAQFQRFVPFPPARWLIMDMSRLRYRHIDRGLAEDRQREIGHLPVT